MFASRALTGSERNYQNLEGERVSSHNMGHGKVPLFSLWKGIHLGNGSKATSIYIQEAYKKHMVKISPKIQRLVVRSFPYQPFNVQYRKGVEIPLADALS